MVRYVSRSPTLGFWVVGRRSIEVLTGSSFMNSNANDDTCTVHDRRKVNTGNYSSVDQPQHPGMQRSV